MSVSFLLSAALALGSLTLMEGRLDAASLDQPFSVVALLVACLDPFAILLEIAAIVLIVWDSRLVGELHRRLAWAAVGCFVLWVVANVGGFLPLTLIGLRRGSLGLVKEGQMIKAGAALLQYTVPFLLAFGLTQGWWRALMWLALALTVIGNFGVVVSPISGMWLEPIEVPGMEMYAPRFDVDYTTGAYPVLLGLGYAGTALYLVAYVALAWRVWRGAEDVPPA
jgi:hypothetical protein